MKRRLRKAHERERLLVEVLACTPGQLTTVPTCWSIQADPKVSGQNGDTVVTIGRIVSTDELLRTG